MPDATCPFVCDRLSFLFFVDSSFAPLLLFKQFTSFRCLLTRAAADLCCRLTSSSEPLLLLLVGLFGSLVLSSGKLLLFFYSFPRISVAYSLRAFRSLLFSVATGMFLSALSLVHVTTWTTAIVIKLPRTTVFLSRILLYPCSSQCRFFLLSGRFCLYSLFNSLLCHPCNI